MRLCKRRAALGCLVGPWLAGACWGVMTGAESGVTPPSVVAAPAAATHVITPALLQAAVVDLRHDPNLGGESKVRTLKWSQSSQPEQRSDSPRWIGGLFDYLGQFSSLFLWGLGIVAVGFAALWIVRNVRWRPGVPAPEIPLPTARVRDLDISPNSLPADVNAAALALCREGRLREALSLLYRASLSRAVNRFGVPIGASFTEREALRAVRASLDAPSARFFGDLVLVWQRVVYAGEDVAVDVVVPLCAEFSQTLDGSPP